MNEISGKRAFKLWPFLLISALSFGQAVEQKPKIICDHAAPPRGMHYVCKSQCDCHLEGKLKKGEDGLAKGWKEDTLQDSRDARLGGTVEIVTENTDTHETRELLGHVAHHWLTKRETIPGPGACAQADVSETDGWYIDYKQPAIS